MKAWLKTHRYRRRECHPHAGDIVSKNGNLLLNLPLRPDGTLDDDELKILDDMAAWMAGQRRSHLRYAPVENLWRRPSVQKGGHFNESKLQYTARDIRFTNPRTGERFTRWRLAGRTMANWCQIAGESRRKRPRTLAARLHRQTRLEANG